MPINIISSFCNYKNKLGIGYNNDLLISLKDDMRHFKSITNGNIVLMGKNTWISIKNKPLKDRISFIFTNDIGLINTEYNQKHFNKNTEYFMNMDIFDSIYNENMNVFIIGGSYVFDIFMNKAENMYLTEIKNFDFKTKIPDCFLKHPGQEYKLINYSKKYIENNVSYRILHYKKINNYKTQENKYLDLAHSIINTGVERIDRTGVGTIGLFATQIKYDISEEFPLFTSKYVNFKNIIEELLWICRGDTNAKILSNKGVKIWDGNSSRDYLDSLNLKYDEGIIGPSYGWQLRFYNAPYDQIYSDTNNIDDSVSIGGIDQLLYVENLLKTDPMSRRILFNLWNPNQLSEMALPPCHMVYMWYVEKKDGVNTLNAQLIMRSNDFFLAGCYNNVTISVLTMILALRCNMQPGIIVHTTNDCHIYKNHIEQMKLQLSRDLRPLPKLVIDDSVKYKNWKDIKYEDFELIGYMPHNYIKAEMAV